mgnify:CR=1 FL=1
MIAELIIISKEKFTAVDGGIVVVLLFGLLYTGSRTVFVLLVISNLVMLFCGKSRLAKALILIGIAVIIIIALYGIMHNGIGAFSRFLTISLKESTFLGRLLYLQDAVPVVLKRPFGLGYMGYYYIQQEIQTGVYAVRFAHNDFLQILLDIGWLPFLLFLTAIIKTVCSKRVPIYKKIILCVISLHCCFDFDMQFVALFFVFLLFTEYDTGKEYIVNNRGAWCTVSMIAASICLYCGIALIFSQLGRSDIAGEMYPWNTENEIILLTEAKNITEANKIADDIISRNTHVQIAYSAKARYYFSKGDFGSLIECKNQIFEKAPFAYEEYEEYCYMLIHGITLYEQAGDMHSAEICKKELLSTKEKVEGAENRLSKLGRMIHDQPITRLPEEITDYIVKIEEGK